MAEIYLTDVPVPLFKDEFVRDMLRETYGMQPNGDNGYKSDRFSAELIHENPNTYATVKIRTDNRDDSKTPIHFKVNNLNQKYRS